MLPKWILSFNLFFLLFVKVLESSNVGESEELQGYRLRHQSKSHLCARCRDLDTRNFTIAVLAPGNDSLPYSLNKTLPAILYAIRTINKLKKFKSFAHRSINMVYQNTFCSSTIGPLSAVDFYIEGTADIFFGPMCPYVLAPVARYSAVWDIPLLTAGGQNDNFDYKFPNYKLLTRMNGSYTQIGIILLQILQKFHWKVLGMLFHNFVDRTKGYSSCYFTLAAVFATLGSRPFHRSFDETDPSTDYMRILKEVSKNARSKFELFFLLIMIFFFFFK